MTGAALRRDHAPRPSILLLAVLAAIGTAYSNVLDGPFVWDDRPLIVAQPLVHEIRPARLLVERFWAPSPDVRDMPYYRPLVSMAYAVEWRVSGGSPFLFHLVNLVAHLAATALVFRLALMGGASPWAAALGSAMFGLAPRLTESVAWISGRTDVFAAVFSLLALAAYCGGKGRAGWRVASAAALFLGLLSKEVAAATLAGLAAFEWARISRGEERPRGALRNLAPAFLAVTAYGLLRWMAFRGTPPVEYPGAPTFLGRLPSTLEALGRYLAMLSDPLRPRLQIGLLAQREPAFVVLGVAVAIGLVVALWRFIRFPPQPVVAAGLGLAGAAVAMVLHVIPFTVNVVAADRFLYLPMAGLAIAGAAASRSLSANLRRPLAALVLLACLAGGVATYMRNVDWSDELRLWRVAVATSPEANPLPANELGSALMRVGRSGEALDSYRKALRVATGKPRISVLANVASTLSNLGRVEEAAPLMEEVVRSQPEVAVNHYNLAILDARRLRFDHARQGLRRALEVMPDYPEAQDALDRIDALDAISARLGPEKADEPTPTVVERADLWSRLGNPIQANRLWVILLGRGDASPPDLQRGATALVRTGDRQQAQEGLLAARRSGLPASVLERLEAELDRRVSLPSAFETGGPVP